MNKITHLIPMTEFIMKVGNDENHLSHEERLAVIYNYAIFLSQPLQEWMFVGEDRLFNYPRTYRKWITEMILDGGKVEFLTNFTDIVYLTPKALEQIYGAETVIKKATE